MVTPPPTMHGYAHFAVRKWSDIVYQEGVARSACSEKTMPHASSLQGKSRQTSSSPKQAKHDVPSTVPHLEVITSRRSRGRLSTPTPDEPPCHGQAWGRSARYL